MHSDEPLLPEPDRDDALPEAESAGPSPRRPKLLEPEVAVLLDPDVEAATQRAWEANQRWREATEREAPSLERIATSGTLRRVDADFVSGYVAVATDEETHRGFVDRVWLGTLLAVLLRRPRTDLEAALAEGPVSITLPAPATPS